MTDPDLWTFAAIMAHTHRSEKGLREITAKRDRGFPERRLVWDSAEGAFTPRWAADQVQTWAKLYPLARQSVIRNAPSEDAVALRARMGMARLNAKIRAKPVQASAAEHLWR